MAREDEDFYDDPQYGGGVRDYSADNVPQDPNEGNYSDEVPDLPQEEIEADEARESVLRNENRRQTPTIGDLRGGLGDAAARTLVKKAGAEKAVQNAKKAEEAVRFSQNIVSDAKNFGAAAKSVGTFFANPWVLIATAVVVLIIICIITVTALAQVYGQTKTSVEGGASYSAGAMQQRLAQRAEWLQQNVTNYSESGALTGSAPSPKGGLSSNAWLAACPQIVQIIYGLSPFLTGYMGANNAYFNYRAHPDMYEAWSFSSGTGNFGAYGDGTSSPGASLQNPPPGAIVSIENQPAWYNTCCPGAGHTFVMLTDELVIDNWSSGGVTLGNPGAGPRILDDGMRGHIVGWALPKSEGFEGSFITGSFEGMAPDAPNQSPMPGLPPVPTYMGDVVAPGGAGGGSFTGDAQHAAWMKAAGIAESDWNYVDYIATRESSWNPKATNAESGACGLIQALPCSKVPGNGYDPVDNLRWANGYAKDRYGSWQAAHQFWQANHWW